MKNDFRYILLSLSWYLHTLYVIKNLLSIRWIAERDVKPVNPKGNQSWIFIGRTDAEAEAPIICLPDVKNWLIGKDPDGGKGWREEEKGMTEDEMVGWHYWLDGHEFEQTPGVGDGQGSLACCSPWGRKESTWLSNWTELNKTEDKISDLEQFWHFHWEFFWEGGAYVGIFGGRLM